MSKQSLIDPVKQSAETNGKILLIFFQEKIKSKDVTELVTVIQKVDSILTKILDTQLYNQIEQTALSYKIFHRTLDKVQTILNEYYKTLLQLNDSGTLERALSNSNLRRNLEQSSTALLVEAATLEEKYSYLEKEYKSRFEPQSLANAGNLEAQPTPSQAKDENKIVLDDHQAQMMWENHIGATVSPLRCIQILQLFFQTDFYG
jgi:hypothetical protein